PGITVSEFKAVNGSLAQATLTIAADAVPGRRRLRVVGGTNGLTSSRPFFVSRLPEVLEKDPNNTLAAAQQVALPVIINGRLDPTLDVDCFTFEARAGQRIVAAVLAHGMDSLLKKYQLAGFVDSSLELLDEQGKVLAAAEDTLGLDPVIEHTFKADGRYALRVQSLEYRGATSAVYRLTVGDVPYPTFVFPPGARRGDQVDLTFGGFNVPPDARQTLTASSASSSPFPWQAVRFDSPLTDGRELSFIQGEFPERIGTEPNDDRPQATELTLPVTVNARFEQGGDVDWYRVHLAKDKGVLLQTTAQRYLRSAVDTVLEVYDATGKKLAENDDGLLFTGQAAHDFDSADSHLSFTAPLEGDYFIRVNDENGGGGPQAIYRLTAEPLQPDFVLYQWPDAVPIWGAGTTASFIVQIQHWGDLTSDVKLQIEGLPPGWTGSTAVISYSAFPYSKPPYGEQALMTITAPADATIGTAVPFRVVGRTEQAGRSIEHVAQPMTLYGSSHNDRMHLRFGEQSRAVVAAPMDSWLETSITELTVPLGGTIQIPVKIHRRADTKGEIAISVDGPLSGQAAATGWRTPLPVAPSLTELLVPVTMHAERRAGTYGIVVSRAWAADIRAGRPGPCTQLITLHVLPAAPAAKP
ncbi:MAG: peptidase domain protein, partial [Planctomycetaceae bacterium]|nr:peptidase domain protein [Planctomycetaceae bacterium]